MNNIGVMFSIQARHAAKICKLVGYENKKIVYGNGDIVHKNRVPVYKKTLEVRKTRPKLETPFKGFIYCTKGGIQGVKGLDDPFKWLSLQGKVIGEFVCDHIYECRDIAGRCFLELNGSCLTLDELNAYSGDKTLYGIHITELVIYDKPKALSEFRAPCKLFRERLCGGRTLCGEHKGICDGTRTLTTAPQSWGYVSI